MSGYGDKLDIIKDRFNKEYCEDNISSEEKRVLKKVIDINARMIDTALNDVSEVPRLQQEMQVVSDKLSEIQEDIKILFDKFDNYIACKKLSTACLLEVQKLITQEAPHTMRQTCEFRVQEILKEKKETVRKDVSFFLELVKYVMYLGPIFWMFYHIKEATP